MNVLLDHCVPRRFGRLLVGHNVQTTYKMGWASLSNGKLLAEAGKQFDAFLTVDQNIPFQQNLSTLPLAVGLIAAPDNRYETLSPFAPTTLNWLAMALKRELVRIKSDGRLIVVVSK